MTRHREAEKMEERESLRGVEEDQQEELKKGCMEKE